MIDAIAAVAARVRQRRVLRERHEQQSLLDFRLREWAVLNQTVERVVHLGVQCGAHREILLGQGVELESALRQMHAVKSGVGAFERQAWRQLMLDGEVPLLGIAVVAKAQRSAVVPAQQYFLEDRVAARRRQEAARIWIAQRVLRSKVVVGRSHHYMVQLVS